MQSLHSRTMSKNEGPKTDPASRQPLNQDRPRTLSYLGSIYQVEQIHRAQINSFLHIQFPNRSCGGKCNIDDETRPFTRR